jgi:hypothetical protein
MSDIVERLRSPEVLITNGLLISPVAHEGAAEIEKLEAENERLRAENDMIRRTAAVWSDAHEKQSELALKYVSELNRVIAQRNEVVAENGRLRAALEEIRDLPGEINTGNYNHDDAVRLNDAFIEAYHIARAALEGK